MATSPSQDGSDSVGPISSPGLQPSLTNVVSRSSRVQDISVSGEPDDSTAAFSGNHEYVNTERDYRSGEDKRPWYRKPSPWWMLTMMPISAMTLAGVSPSLLQIYTELVCKDIRKPAPSLEEPYISQTRGLLDLPEYYSVTPGIGQDGPIQFGPRSDDYLWLVSAKHESEEPSCASDPVVQAAVSKLLAALLSTQGALSCVTAASWASLSDRLGRRPILTLTSSAVIICYSIFIAVYYLSDFLPGRYWILLFGPLIYGLLGGNAGTTAATYAYISDCTPNESRAGVFSLTLGLRFTGMAIGPTLCALIVHFTGTPIAALVLVIGTHIVYALMMLFVVPESLPSEKRAENRRVWRETRNAGASGDARGNEDGIPNRIVQKSRSLVRSALAFLRPLSVAGPISVTQPSGKIHKDWSLTFIVVSNGLASMILASYTSMFQFAAGEFGWSSVELGYWYSGIVAARALTLTLFLPIIIEIYHYFTSRSVNERCAEAVSEVNDATTPLLYEDRDSPSTSQDQPRAASKAQVQARKTPAFDLAIAQSSLALEIVCYALVPVLYSSGAVLFIVFTILASCGAGFGPAIQALAVDIYNGRGGTETGRLFGVLSVIQTISSQILGPAIYSLTYMKIVAFFPQGIFFVSVAAVTCALISLLFVELPASKGSVSLREEDTSA
ncbi:hypothetical protein ACEPAF_4346 [Sanghuangporus sanghuang]